MRILSHHKEEGCDGSAVLGLVDEVLAVPLPCFTESLIRAAPHVVYVKFSRSFEKLGFQYGGSTFWLFQSQKIM